VHGAQSRLWRSPANEQTDVHLNGRSSNRRGACGGGTLPDAGRISLPARVRITEAAVTGDHLLPAHLQGSHAAILLHNAAADIAQRAPRPLVGIAAATVVVTRMVRMGHSGRKMAACGACRDPSFTLLKLQAILFIDEIWLRFAIYN
jgi:hypothetical protein